MHLTVHTIAGPEVELRLPWGGGVVNVAYVCEHYPEYAAEMDGSDLGSCLLLFYERSPVSGVYEFRDADSEADIAEWMGMDLTVCVDGESTAEKASRLSGQADC